VIAMSKLYPIVWKETKDMFRDLRTLSIIAVLPLLIMPLMGLSSIYLQRFQYGVAVVVDNDRASATIGNATFTSSDIANALARRLSLNGFTVYREESVKDFDVEVVIPRGFINNLTSLTSQALIKVVKRVGSSKAEVAISLVNAVASDLVRKVANAKVMLLASLANISVKTESVIYPVVLSIGLVGPYGGATTPEEDIRARISRLISFSLIFVTTPSIAFITDSIIGEKERKTFEALLSTPVPRYSVVLGKVLSSSLVGLVAGLSDATGLLLFFAIPSVIYGVNLLGYLTPSIVATHASAVYISVLASLAMIMPIIIRTGSYRASQAASLSIIGVSSIVFFISLYVDLPNLLPLVKYILYVIPYTHAVIMIRNAVMGLAVNSIIHGLIALAESSGLLLLSVKLFNDERIIYSKT